jgi:hypothetical protein
MQLRLRPFLMVSLLLCTFSAVMLQLSVRTASAAATTVREPAFGLPHFYADTDLELARENGREIAKDRLGQLILLARVGRGTLDQAFGLLDPGTINDDIEARQTAYTSSELNNMWAKFPERERDAILEYCKGVNDTIDAIYAGTLPEPIELSVVRFVLFLGDDIFGNATNISDQVDPFYLAPGGADPERPDGGFQFTPELAVAIGILQVRTFGLESFNEPARLDELQDLIAKHGATAGTEIWDDRNFLNDPLAPISVPDPTTPGFGGPLARARDLTRLASLAGRFPRYDYAAAVRRHEEAMAHRAEFARKWGAWPALGSYAWIIAGGKSMSGHPWIGGFPQTGIQTPSIMHFAENRSAEGPNPIQGIGMEFAGAPIILIGQTDTVAWTSTTAQLRVIDTFLEEIVGEDNDSVRYSDEGAPAALSQRTETFRAFAGPDQTRVFWRSHARAGNNGSRAITDFFGDASGTAESGTANTLVDTDASFGGSFIGGHVLIIDGTGAGQIRAISAVPSADTLQVGTSWTAQPAVGSVYVAVESGNTITAAAIDSPAWLEESTTVAGFAQFQRAQDVLDVRAGARLMTTTHNFPSADNQAFNTFGTQSGSGNTGYYSSGLSRIRQGGEDPRLPLDGTVANPLVVVSGTVNSSTDTTLTATSAVFTQDFSAEPINFRYNNPTQLGSEFIIAITSGTGYKQTRRIATNASPPTDTITVEFPWAVNPANGDTFEVYEIVAMPEAVNPSEGYTANWNNKAATADEGDGFGRQHRNAAILERLAVDNTWDRDKQRQLNKDVAGLDGRGKYGRFLIPRLREAVDAVGNGGNPDVDTVLAALEAHNGAPELGRFFIDPVTATEAAGELDFLNDLANQLAQDIYGDEYSGAIGVPGGGDAVNIVQHAIDSAAGDVAGSYIQAHSGDYFNGTGWETVVRDTLSGLASGGIPADSPRGNSTYNHPLAALFPGGELNFEPTPVGNRGTYEQIVDVGPVVNGEFIFPLGHSGHIEGSFFGVTAIDPNVTSLHPLWRDWRFAPMLHVSQDLAGGGSADADGDGVFDAFERWYFGDNSPKATDDDDKDKASLLDEFLAGTDPTDADTDDDGIVDGRDTFGQDRLRSGFIKFKGKLSLKGSNNDRLSVSSKIGSSTLFDPTTQDITVTVSNDDGEIYSVTIPAGTMSPNASGRLFKYKDTTGSLNDLQQVILKRSGSATGKGSFKFKTVKTDFSAVTLEEQVVDVVLEIDTHTIADSRTWEVKGSFNLKSIK